jgi:hypothetical protein
MKILKLSDIALQMIVFPRRAALRLREISMNMEEMLGFLALLILLPGVFAFLIFLSVLPAEIFWVFVPMVLGFFVFFILPAAIGITYLYLFLLQQLGKKYFVGRFDSVKTVVPPFVVLAFAGFFANLVLISFVAGFLPLIVERILYFTLGAYLLGIAFYIQQIRFVNEYLEMKSLGKTFLVMFIPVVPFMLLGLVVEILL